MQIIARLIPSIKMGQAPCNMKILGNYKPTRQGRAILSLAGSDDQESNVFEDSSSMMIELASI